VFRVHLKTLCALLLSAGVYLAAATAPTITTQPSNARVAIGQTATFSVAATADSGPLSYQWYRRTATGNYLPVAGATSASYTTAATTLPENDSAVFARVTSPGGMVDSTRVSLFVVPTITITAQPADIKVVAGQTATFTAGATVDEGTLSYQWYRSPSGGGTYTAVSGAISASYTTAATALTDTNSGIYVRVSSGGAMVESYHATLTVLPAVAPTISTQPRNARVAIGQSATYSVVASGGSGTLTYQWYRRTATGNYLPVAGATSVSYTTAGTTLAENDSGIFVRVTGPGGMVESTHVSLFVVPTITITAQPADIKVVAGQTATFTAGATVDEGTLSYQWYRSPSGGGTYTAVAGATSASYTTGAVSLTDTNSGICVRVSSGGAMVESYHATLTVQPAVAPTITTQPGNARVTIGQSATYTVVASGGSGALTYQWYRRTATGNYLPVSGATTATYTTEPTKLADNDSGIFVRVSNGGGMVESIHVSLYVVPTITITNQPADLKVVEGQTATFTVGAMVDDGPLSYQWYRSPSGGGTYSAVPGATSASYTTEATTLGVTNSGIYVRVSSGGALKESYHATLTVEEAAVPSFAGNLILTPKISSIPAGGTQALTANQPVTWSLSSGSLSYTNTTATFRAVVNGSNLPDGTYTVTATSKADTSLTATAYITVYVEGSAVINTFTATPASIHAGQPVTLSWDVINAENLWMESEDGSVVVTGNSLTVTPGGNRTYTLHVSPASRQVYAVVSVNVDMIPEIEAFSATQSIVSPGGSSQLTARFVNGTGHIDQGVGPVENGVPVTVSPAGFTTYALTVTNPYGASQTRRNTLNVVTPGQYLTLPDMSVAQSTCTATALHDGRVLFVGGWMKDANGNWQTTSATAQIFDPATSRFEIVGNLRQPRYGHTATMFPDGRVLIWGGSVYYSGTNTTYRKRDYEVFDPLTNTFSSYGIYAGYPNSIAMRSRHTATLLADGRVLIAGGVSLKDGLTYSFNEEDIVPLKTTLLVNAGTSTGSDPDLAAVGAMNVPRAGHVAVRLLDGRVLVAGGSNVTGSLTSMEVYDSASGLWTLVGDLHQAEHAKNPILLSDGRVLFDGFEIFDPSTSTISTLDSPYSGFSGFGAEAVLLPDGKIHMGLLPAHTLQPVLYDPIQNVGLTPDSTATPSGLYENLTLLKDGTLLASGGPGSSKTQAVLFDPQSAFTVQPATAHASSGVPITLAVNGVVSGGVTWSASGGVMLQDGTFRAEVPGWYAVTATALDGRRSTAWVDVHPAAQVIFQGPIGYPGNTGKLRAETPFQFHARVLNTPDQRVTWSLLEGVEAGVITQDGWFTAAREGTWHVVATSVLDPSQSASFPVETLPAIQMSLVPQTMTLMAGESAEFTAQETRGDGAARWTSNGAVISDTSASCSYTAPMTPGTYTLTATSLVDTTKSANASITVVPMTEFFISPSRIVVSPGKTIKVQAWAASILGLKDLSRRVEWKAESGWLGSGSGDDGAVVKYYTPPSEPGIYTITAEIKAAALTVSAYITVAPEDSFHTAGPTTATRNGHSQTRLLDGRVLLAGGNGLKSAEIFDPVTRLFTALPTNMTAIRTRHTATLLPDGKVLLVGGENLAASAEIYNPSTNTFSPTIGAPISKRSNHFARLLPNGLVLIAGGEDGLDSRSMELYDPASGCFSTAGNLNTANGAIYGDALVLADGRVLFAGGKPKIVGGVSIGSRQNESELFDFRTGLCTPAGTMKAERSGFKLVHTEDDAVWLLAGSLKGGSTRTKPTTERFDPITGQFTLGPTQPARDGVCLTELVDGGVWYTGWLDSSQRGTTFRSRPQLFEDAIFPVTEYSSNALLATLLPGGNVLIAGKDYYGSHASLVPFETLPKVSVIPHRVTLVGGSSYPFQASCTGLGNGAVNWSILEGEAGGQISSQGVYTAPVKRGNYHILATSAIDGSLKASATVSVTAHIRILPAFLHLNPGSSKALGATTMGLSQGIIWSCQGGEITSEGVYTAPMASGRCTITATAMEDASVSSSIQVDVLPAPEILGFTASAAGTVPGSPVTLYPQFQHGVGVIDKGVGGVRSGEPIMVLPAATCPYTLTVTNALGDSVTQTLTITVVPAPDTRITTASPVTAGSVGLVATVPNLSGATYTWSVQGGTITSGAASQAMYYKAGASGPIKLSCTVKNAYGITATGSATVNALPVPEATSLTASKAAISRGSSAELLPVFANGTGFLDQGIGGVSSGQIVVVAPVVTTTYTLKVMNSAGTTATKTVTISVVSAPDATISAASSVTSGATSQSASVPNMTGATYAWSIQGGTITSGGTGRTVYYTAGTGSALALMCTVTSPAGITATGTANISIIPAPEATALSASKTAISKGESLTLTPLYIQGTGVLDQGIGGVSSGQSITVAPSANTNYTLTVTNAAGATSTRTVSIKVLTAPNPSISAASPVTAGATGRTAAVASVSGASYAWSVQGGTISSGASSSTVNYTAGPSGPILLTCVVTNEAGVSVSGTATVEVVPAATIQSFSATTNPVAKGESTVITPVFTQGVGFIDKGIGGVTSGQAVTVSPVASTTYTLRVTDAAGTIVNKALGVNVTAESGPAAISAPSPVTANAASCNATVAGMAGATYAWSIQGGTITSGATSSSMYFTAGATGPVTLTCAVKSSAGVTTTGTAILAVVPAPLANSLTASRTSMAKGTSITLTPVFSQGTGVMDQGIGGVTSGQALSVSPRVNSIYTLTVTNPAGVAATKSVSIQVLEAPDAAITAASPVTVGATGRQASVLSATGSTYAWSIQGGTITSGANASTVYYTAGTTGAVVLSCTVTDAAGVSSTGTVSVATVPAPVATSLTASRTAIAKGESLTLTPVFDLGNATLNQGIGGVTSGQIVTVSPVMNTTYMLNVMNAAGTITSKSVTIEVLGTPDPTITAASPVTAGLGGQRASLPSLTGATYTWSIQGGTITSGASTNSIYYTPGSTGPITLTCVVKNAAGISNTGTMSVDVVPAPVITAFTSSAANIAAGGSVLLTPTFANGTGVIDQGVGAVQDSQPVSVVVESTRTYILTVTNPAGALASKSLTVTVPSSPPVGVVISPLSATMPRGGKRTFSAAVSNAVDTSVTWSLLEAGGGSITSGGEYTTPSLDGLYHLVATSVQDPGKSACVPILVNERGAISVAGVYVVPDSGWNGSLTLFQDGETITGYYGGNTSSVVSGTLQGLVLEGIQGSNGGHFRISFAPDGSSFAGVWGSTSDASLMPFPFSGTRNPSALDLRVEPGTIELPPGGWALFKGLVAHVESGVTWTASGGTIDASGLYQAPASEGTYTVSATTVAAPSKTVSATVVVKTDGGTVGTAPVIHSFLAVPTTMSPGGNAQLTWDVTNALRLIIRDGKGTTLDVTGKDILQVSPEATETYTLIAVNQSGSTQQSQTVTVQDSGITIGIAPTSASLYCSQSMKFGLSLYAPTNRVVWGSTTGSITQEGLFTAPNQAGTCTVSVVSVDDPSKRATATVMVTDIFLQLAPASITLDPGQSMQFEFNCNGADGNSLVWACTGGTVTQKGFYTAPIQLGTYSISLYSTAEPSLVRTAKVVVSTPLIQITPGLARISLGGTRKFQALVRSGTVAWSVLEPNGGSITPDGNYTAPLIAGTYTVIATSSLDSSIRATAKAVVRNGGGGSGPIPGLPHTGVPGSTGIQVTLTPGTLEVDAGTHYPFTVAVSGAEDQTVAWSLVGSPENATVDATGDFIASSRGVYEIQAASIVDPTAVVRGTVVVESAFHHSDNPLAELRGYSVTALDDGKVLIVGGAPVNEPDVSRDSMGRPNYTPTANAWLYDPESGNYSITGNLLTARFGHKTVKLTDGKVLIAGGFARWINPWDSLHKTESWCQPFPFSEIYDPVSGTFSSLPIQSHVASSWKITDPASISGAGMMWSNHGCATAARMSDGRVLVAGDSPYIYDWWASMKSSDTASDHKFTGVDIFDPASMTFDLAPSAPWRNSIEWKTGPYPPDDAYMGIGAGAYPPLENLQDGRLMIGWGLNGLPTRAYVDELLPGTQFYSPTHIESLPALLLQPSSFAVSRTGPMQVSRFNHTLTRLADGRILAVGGMDCLHGTWTSNDSRGDGEWRVDMTATAEIYDPETNAWTLTGSMSQARAHHAAILLPTGQVLIAGGECFNLNNPGQLLYPNYFELFDPDTGKFSVMDKLDYGLSEPQLVLLQDGSWFLAGQVQAPMDPPTAQASNQARMMKMGAAPDLSITTLLAGMTVAGTGGQCPPLVSIRCDSDHKVLGPVNDGSVWGDSNGRKYSVDIWNCNDPKTVDPISQTMGTKLTLNVQVYLGASINTQYTLIGTGSHGYSTFTGTKVANGKLQFVKMTAGEALPNKVGVLTETIRWTLQSATETKFIGTTGPFRIYVTYGKPIDKKDDGTFVVDPRGYRKACDVTENRLNWCCTKARGLSNSDAITKAVYDALSVTNFGYFAKDKPDDQSYAPYIWSLLDGKQAGDCITLANLMEWQMLMLGIPATRGFVYASDVVPDPPTSCYTDWDEDNPSEHWKTRLCPVHGWTEELWFYAPYTPDNPDVPNKGINRWEGVCKVGDTFYAPTALYTTEPFAMIRSFIPDPDFKFKDPTVGPQAGDRFQVWRYKDDFKRRYDCTKDKYPQPRP